MESIQGKAVKMIKCKNMAPIKKLLSMQSGLSGLEKKDAWRRNEGDTERAKKERLFTVSPNTRIREHQTKLARSHAQNKLKEVIQAQLTVDLWHSLTKDDKDAKFYLGSEKDWTN